MQNFNIVRRAGISLSLIGSMIPLAFVVPAALQDAAH